jgi:hypothetical protein
MDPGGAGVGAHIAEAIFYFYRFCHFLRYPRFFLYYIRLSSLWYNQRNKAQEN